MQALPKGAYDKLTTDALDQALRSAEFADLGERDKLHPADAADRIALHVSTVMERALDALPEEGRVDVGIRLARRLIEQIVETPEGSSLVGETTRQISELAVSSPSPSY
jgi:hypothetical protein